MAVFPITCHIILSKKKGSNLHFIKPKLNKNVPSVIETHFFFQGVNSIKVKFQSKSSVCKYYGKFPVSFDLLGNVNLVSD